MSVQGRSAGLLGVSAPVAERAEMHTHVMQGDLMRMRPVEAVEVRPRTPVTGREHTGSSNGGSPPPPKGRGGIRTHE